MPSEQGYELRWFSPACELKLCGHATLGAAFVLFHFVRPDLEKVLFSTRFRGPLTVGRNGDWLSMQFPALAAKACTPRAELLKALGPSLASGDVVQVFAGNETYVTVLSSADKVRDFQPDFARLEHLHPHVVVLTAAGEEVDFVSRYFAPGYGIPEDSLPDPPIACWPRFGRTG